MCVLQLYMYLPDIWPHMAWTHRVRPSATLCMREEGARASAPAPPAARWSLPPARARWSPPALCPGSLCRVSGWDMIVELWSFCFFRILKLAVITARFVLMVGGQYDDDTLTDSRGDLTYSYLARFSVRTGHGHTASPGAGRHVWDNVARSVSENIRHCHDAPYNIYIPPHAAHPHRSAGGTC